MKFFLLFVIFTISFSAHALKVDTHVWVGQQIINDLEEDGKLTFKLNGEQVTIAIEQNIVDAILNNKSDFLMGNIGPDAAPDVVVGQTIIHPGVKDTDKKNIGWQTNEWLEYLLTNANENDIGKAYVYGFLGHAAADVFAHTYVNQYAGDIFDITDESLVEQRHFILEGYISEYTPPLTNYLGQDIGPAWQQITLDDKYANFVRDTLVYNDTVQQEYKKSPFAPHLTAYYDFRNAIDALAEDGIWHDLDILTTQIVAQYYGIDLSSDEAGAIVDAAQPIIDVLNGDIPDALQELDEELYSKARKYEELGFSEVIAAVEKMNNLENKLLSTKQSFDNELAGLSSQLRTAHCKILDEALDIIDPTGITKFVVETSPILSSSLDLIDKLFGGGGTPSWEKTISGNRSELESYIYDYHNPNDECYNQWGDLTSYSFLRDYVNSPCYKYYEHRDLNSSFIKIIENALSFLESDIDKITIRQTYNSITVTVADGTILYSITEDETYTQDAGICYDINAQIDNLNSLSLQTIHGLQQTLLSEKQDLRQAAIDLRDELLVAQESVRQTVNAIIDLNQLHHADVSPIQSLLRGWRSDVDLAMAAYVKASGQAMLNTMDSNANAIDPITEWFQCYHLSIIGVPSPIGGCDGLISGLARLLSAIENIIVILDNAVTPVPGLSELKELKDDLIDSLVNKLKEKVSDKIVDALPQGVQDILVLLDKDIDDAVLNQFFTKEETVTPAKGLLMIPDMADRVKAEMHLRADGNFDPEKFAVIHNAIVLAKLALLNKTGFETLAETAGSSDYTKYTDELSNIVAQAFGNIDGNHQWMPTPPPLPNTLNSYPPVDYTYSSDRSALGEYGGLGFVLWKEDLRDTLFRKLFIGPLSPGIDAPTVINQPVILNSDYPYVVCLEHPYPNNINDRTCTGGDSGIQAPTDPGLDKPNKPNVSLINSDSIKVDWNDVSNADWYDISVKLNDNDWTDYDHTVTDSQYISSDLDPGNRKYRVRACNASECSEASLESDIAQLLAAPGTPEVTVEGNNITLSWPPSPDAQWYEVSIKMNNSDWTGFVHSTDTASISWSGIEAGEMYYQIRACNSLGCFEPSSASDAVNVGSGYGSVLTESQLLALTNNQAQAVGKITEVRLNNDIAIFRTDENKTHDKLPCISGDENDWAVSSSDNDGLYPLLLIARETQQALEATPGTTCLSGIEKPGTVNINYSASGNEKPLISPELNFIARSQIVTADNISEIRVQFGLTLASEDTRWLTAQEKNGYYLANFGLLAPGNYSFTTKVTSEMDNESQVTEEVTQFSVSQASE